MEDAVFALTFNPEELAFVADLLGNSPRLLKDPFSGRQAECVKKAQQQAQESLVVRDFIRVQADGHPALDTAVAALVGALAFAESALTITRLVGVE